MRDAPQASVNGCFSGSDLHISVPSRQGPIFPSGCDEPAFSGARPPPGGSALSPGSERDLICPTPQPNPAASRAAPPTADDILDALDPEQRTRWRRRPADRCACSPAPAPADPGHHPPNRLRRTVAYQPQRVLAVTLPTARAQTGEDAHTTRLREGRPPAMQAGRSTPRHCRPISPTTSGPRRSGVPVLHTRHP